MAKQQTLTSRAAQVAETMSAKRRAFKNVGEPRLENALNALAYLGQCSDGQRYEIYDSDVEIIRSRLTQAVADVIARFEKRSRKPVITFD